MKFAAALCLFACVAVSHAAFSGSLVKQAQPLVNQAIFKIRLATVSRNSEGAALQTAVVSGLQAHVEGLLAQIQSGVEVATGVYDDILAQITQTQTQIAALVGGVQTHVTQIVSGLIQNLSQMWVGIFGKAASRGLGNWFAGLFPAEWNVAEIISVIHWKVQGLIGEVDIMTVAQAVLAEHLNLPDSIVQFILTNFGSLLAADQNRWNFDSIWQGLLNGLPAGLVTQIQSIAQSLIASGTQSFQQIQDLAQQFADHAQAQAAQITGAAAQQLLEFLAPHAQDLGALWTQVQTQVQGIIAVLPISN